VVVITFMKDKELKLGEIKVSLTQGGVGKSRVTEESGEGVDTNVLIFVY
jgi:hypothetical protein